MVFTHSTDSLYACLGDSLTPATRPNFTNWKTKGNEQLSRTHQGFPKHQEHTVKSPFSMPNWHAVPVVPLVITYRNSWHPAKNTPPWSTSAAASPGFSPRHEKNDWNHGSKILHHHYLPLSFSGIQFPLLNMSEVPSPAPGLINIDLLVLWLDHAFSISQDPGRQLHCTPTPYRVGLQSKPQ